MSTPARLLPDDPSAPLIHRLLLALGIQPEHAVGRHEAVIETAVRIRADAHRYPVVVEDWSTVREERDLLAAIVGDLAATDARYRTTDGIACGLCGAEFPTGSGAPSYVDNHPDHCPLRRACEWVEAQETP